MQARATLPRGCKAAARVCAAGADEPRQAAIAPGQLLLGVKAQARALKGVPAHVCKLVQVQLVLRRTSKHEGAAAAAACACGLRWLALLLLGARCKTTAAHLVRGAVLGIVIVDERHVGAEGLQALGRLRV